MMFYWIIILVCLRFIRAEEIWYAQVGATVILPRNSQGVFGVNEGLYVNWYHGSEDTPSISRNPHGAISKGKPRFSLLPDFSLQISPVDESDFGVFRCEQHKGIESNEFPYRLLRVTTSKVQTVMVEASLSLKCELEASSLSKTAKVMWIPPETSGCKLDIRPPIGNHISVVHVPICASGVWTCSVKYNLKEVTATTTVYVIDLSPAPADPIYTSVSQSVVDISCSLSSDIPWTLLTESGLQGGSWSFTPLDNKKQKEPLLSLIVGEKIQWNVTKGAPIAVQGREVKNNDLSILKLPVSKEIQGEYTCSLAFRDKKFNRKVKVMLLQVSSAADPPLYEGKMVNLSCLVGPYLETPKDLEIKWKCPSACNSHSLLRLSPHRAFMSIPVRMEDNGRWTCELYKNNTRLTFAELLLRIEKAPVDIWLWVAISSGVVVFILLLVIIIIAIRRHKQMVMHRRRKTRFCCCKTPQQKGFYKT